MKWRLRDRNHELVEGMMALGYVYEKCDADLWWHSSLIVDGWAVRVWRSRTLEEAKQRVSEAVAQGMTRHRHASERK